MGALIPFAYGDALVRVVEIAGDPWWVAGDVAKTLGYRDAEKLVRSLDEDEADTHIVGIRSSNGVEQDRAVAIISESGLYHAIFLSRRAEAKRFRKWVTSEVLPTIRREGGYRTPATARAGEWEALNQRIGDLERLVSSQALVETEEFANAARFSPAIMQLLHPDGSLRRQRNPRWWSDMPVRLMAIRLHRQTTISQAVAQIIAEFGADRAPSRSSLGRAWKKLDLLRAAG